MAVDLAKLYARVKQRAERDRDTPYASLAEAARTAARAIMSSQTQVAARKFATAERAWLRERPQLLEPVGKEFLEAIRSNDYVCNYRTINNFHTGHDPHFGWIYLVTSKARPAQVKIGYTNEIRRRLLKMRRDHEPEAVLHWARWVRFPSRLESALHSELREHRIAGNITGASTEWFKFDALNVELRIIRQLNPECEYWADEVIYSYDPEARQIERFSNS